MEGKRNKEIREGRMSECDVTYSNIFCSDEVPITEPSSLQQDGGRPTGI